MCRIVGVSAQWSFGKRASGIDWEWDVLSGFGSLASFVCMTLYLFGCEFWGPDDRAFAMHFLAV